MFLYLVLSDKHQCCFRWMLRPVAFTKCADALPRLLVLYAAKHDWRDKNILFGCRCTQEGRTKAGAPTHDDNRPPSWADRQTQTELLGFRHALCSSFAHPITCRSDTSVDILQVRVRLSTCIQGGRQKRRREDEEKQKTKEEKEIEKYVG